MNGITATAPMDTPSVEPSAILIPRTTPTTRQLLPWGGLSALALYLCYFPVNLGLLGWIALVPLLVLVRSQARNLHIFQAGWFAGLAFFFPILQWMRVADPRMYFTWIMLAVYCSLYFPVGVLLVRALDRRRVPLVLSLPVVWTALEFLRAHLLGGFPWYYLAHTQHDFLPIIQIADTTGAWGVTFLVAAVNALVFEWLWRVFRAASGVGRPVLVFESALVLLTFAGFFGYGSWRMKQAAFEEGPRLALVQCNVEQQIRIDRDDPKARENVLKHLEENLKRMARLAASRQPDLIVYPETSYTDDWNEIIIDRVDRLNDEGRAMLREMAALARNEVDLHTWQGRRPHVLLGLNTSEWYPDQHPSRLRYNSALLIGPAGKAVGRYDKIHRVPFGEYVPLREALPFMDRLAPYDYDYSIAPGREQTRLPLGKYTFGVVICYEDTDTELARRYVDPARGEKVDFLVNTSNDGWFDGTAEHEQHLATCRFRAVETRRAVARSVNMGISAVIDGNGRVLAPAQVGEEEQVLLWETGAKAGALPCARWGSFKKVPGVLVATIPLDNRDSLHARWGDWLPWTCAALLGFLLVIGRFSRQAARAALAT